MRPDRATLVTVLGLSTVASGVWPACGQQSASRQLTHDIPLTGTASGGTLLLVEGFNRKPRFASIGTGRGENAASVATRLAEALDLRDPFGWTDGLVAPLPRRAGDGGKIQQLPGMAGAGEFVLAGSETGLGIPAPPTSVTGTWDTTTKSVRFRWANPPGNYDTVTIRGSDFRFGERLAGTATSWEWKTDGQPLEGVDVRVIGYRNGIPSNIGHMTLNGRAQEELIGSPFAAGIAPNWCGWSVGTGVTLEQSEPRRNDLEGIKEPQHKPFAQVIRTESPDAVGGAWRKFLGLRPGHTYRLWVRMNTRQGQDLAWSFSCHAMALKSGQTLTPAQMAGRVNLPDGQTGEAAARVAGYGGTASSYGAYVTRATHLEGPGKEIGDIAVGSSQDTIFVWFRCTNVPRGVEFDWIKLEDVTRE